MPEVFENLETWTKWPGMEEPEQKKRSLAMECQPPPMEVAAWVEERSETMRGARETQSSRQRTRLATARRRRLTQAATEMTRGSKFRDRKMRRRTCSFWMPELELLSSLVGSWGEMERRWLSDGSIFGCVCVCVWILRLVSVGTTEVMYRKFVWV